MQRHSYFNNATVLSENIREFYLLFQELLIFYSIFRVEDSPFPVKGGGLGVGPRIIDYSKILG